MLLDIELKNKFFETFMTLVASDGMSSDCAAMTAPPDAVVACHPTIKHQLPTCNRQLQTMQSNHVILRR